MTTFSAIDLETANNDRASICQIAIVDFVDGNEVDAWSTLIDPHAPFHERNTSIHGITAQDVAGAPSLADVRTDIKRRLSGRTVVSHSSFDRISIERAGIALSGASWADTLSLARQKWPGVDGGYGLANLCQIHGIELNHHDALSDARACGRLYTMMGQHTPSDKDLTQAPTQRRKPPRPNAYLEGLAQRLEGKQQSSIKASSVMENLARRLELLRQ